MRKLSIALALAAATGITTFTAYSPALHAADRHEQRHDETKEDAGWVKLGERKVDFKGDHDVIEVGREEGKFTQLRVRCVQGDLEMYKMRIFFMHDDHPFTPDTKVHFHEGERTHSIDLPGDARTIKKVEFSYRSDSRHEPAVIELLGKEKH